MIIETWTARKKSGEQTARRRRTEAPRSEFRYLSEKKRRPTWIETLLSIGRRWHERASVSMNWSPGMNNRQSEVSRRATSNASNRPDARAEIQRLATEEGACHRSCESKNWKQKKREVRARAPLAPADPYTMNILRRAPAWCIFFGIKVIVTLWPAGSAKDSFGSLVPINANLLLYGILGRNRAIYETVGVVVIPFKRIRRTSQALPSNCRRTRSPRDALRITKSSRVHSWISNSQCIIWEVN